MYNICKLNVRKDNLWSNVRSETGNNSPSSKCELYTRLHVTTLILYVHMRNWHYKTKITHYLNWLSKKWIMQPCDPETWQVLTDIGIVWQHKQMPEWIYCILIYLKVAPWICQLFDNNTFENTFLSWQHKLSFTCISDLCMSSLFLIHPI